MKRITIICLVLLFAAIPVQGQDNSPDRKNGLIRFYQNHLSAVDGHRCPMNPSCSEYAAQAIKKHGPLKGWIMALDRIQRCGRDELQLAPEVKIRGRSYTHDPVTANDFWWFKKKPEPPGLPR